MSFDPTVPGIAGLRASLGLRPMAKGGSTTEPPANAARPPEHGAVGKLVSFVHPDSGEQHVGKVISGSHKGVAATDETGRIHRVDHGAYQLAPKGAKPGKLEAAAETSGGGGAAGAAAGAAEAPAGTKPPGDGWSPVPNSTHGGMRRRSPSGSWEYWHPSGATHEVPNHIGWRALDAHETLNEHVADWVFHNDGASKQKMFDAYAKLPDGHKQALDAEVRHTVLARHGSDKFTAYRAMRPGDDPKDMGGRSVSEHASHMGDVHAFEVDADDVLLHHGQEDSHLNSRAYKHEQEVILKPGAKVKHLGPIGAMNKGTDGDELGPGWQPIPKSSHGGLRRKRSDGSWEYHYPGGAPLFHAAPHGSVASIAESGLQPRAGEGLYKHGGYDKHSQGKVFLSSHDDAARTWSRKVHAQLENQHEDQEQHVPVTLRVRHRATERDEVGDSDVPGSRHTNQAIPPEDLEFYRPGSGWRNMTDWDPEGADHPSKGLVGSKGDKHVASAYASDPKERRRTFHPPTADDAHGPNRSKPVEASEKSEQPVEEPKPAAAPATSFPEKGSWREKGYKAPPSVVWMDLDDKERDQFLQLKSTYKDDAKAMQAKVAELLATRTSTGHNGLSRPGDGVGSGNYWQLVLGVDPDGQPETRGERASRLAPTEE